MEFEVVVPALHFHASDGRLDMDATRRYAVRAVGTWVDRFIVSGSTTRGDLLASAQRAALLDLWLDVADDSRLLACAWCADDLAYAEHRGVVSLAVMRGLINRRAACGFFAGLPPNVYVYSHSVYSPTVLDAELAECARAQGVLPKGAKIAKIAIEEIGAVRKIVGANFSLWDGSSRHIRASLEAGASGVVATPLNALPAPFPDRSVAALQLVIDKIQAKLDRQPRGAARLALLTELAHDGGRDAPKS
ncbi:MAG: hypothetical protein ACRDYA_24490 [Egibacteraceae bacterium]